MKKAFGAISISMMLGFGFAGASSALTYQDGSDVQFTFNSTLSIALSDVDIVIGGLIPGQDDLSNVVDIVINTNNLYGYTLTATVGNASHDYRDLRHDANSSANFASIAVGGDLATLSGESSSVWGYKVSTNGTTWSNFNGLPKYDDTSSTAELNVTDGAVADSTTSFRIGAYAAEGQLAGDYTNVINFKVVSNVGKTYIQDVTTATCPTEPSIVYDRRDEEEYTIQKLADGNCWMLDNLRLDLVNVALNTLKGNTNASDETLEYLKNGGGTTSDKYPTSVVADWVSGQRLYSVPLIDTSNNDTVVTRGHYKEGRVGTYYNYCAASAGSYCYGNGTSAGSSYGSASEDICPAGWRMPVSGSNASKNEYALLYTAYGSVTKDFTIALRAPLSGYYYDGATTTQGMYGCYWSSSWKSDIAMYIMNIDGAYITPDTNTNRNVGNTVRCILK